MGRKPVPADLKRDVRLAVMLTANEMSILEGAAKASNAESLSAWVRDTLLKVANINGTD